MWISGIDHVQVSGPPGCEDAARGFYGALLGLDEVAKPAGLAGRGGVWFLAGDQGLHVGVDLAHLPARKAHPALRTSDDAIEVVAQALTRAGAPVVWDEQAGVRRFFTEDPFGNRVEITAGPA